MHALPHIYPGVVGLAPMAGITDRPFRQICRQWGASFAVAEMLTSDASLWHTRKSRLRMDFSGESGPRIVQIAGADPDMLAHAAQLNVQRGADVIDINMGCPAKKVCKKAAGSALLADESLVETLLRAVTAAVDVPVTLKYRTGTTPQHNNAQHIARLAQDCGIAALALHGRSRQDAYKGEAEHDTVRAVKTCVRIPVLANGDVSNAHQAQAVLQHSQADGLLVGRGAQGRPWLFAQINALLKDGQSLPEPSFAQQRETMLEHIAAIHSFYGAEGGVRIARKHIGWYLQNWPNTQALRRRLVRIACARQQLQELTEHTAQLPPAQAA